MKFKLSKIFPAVIFASLSVSSPSYAGVVEEHARLIEIVEMVGVDFIVNHPECDEMLYDGWYSGVKKELVVCQRNKVEGSSSMVEWTVDDLDTLRHESHHVVQDCMDNKLDGNLSVVYEKPIELGIGVMGEEKTIKVVEAYDDAPEFIQVLEIEAFAVAQMNDVKEQASDIVKYCF